VLGLTRHTAREVAAYNISVNAVAPGSLATEMTSFVTPEQLARIETNIPLGRRGRAEEAAAAVVFLVSEQASFITGATLDVNGGNLMI
jgi:3-oxoacyl-[acyl-carrier protein] reductase